MLFDSNAPMSLKRARHLLAVDEKSDIDFIKQSYRRAAKLYHPDAPSGLSDPDMFNNIVTAYNFILKEKKSGGALSSFRSGLARNRSKKQTKRSWRANGARESRFSFFSFFKSGRAVARENNGYKKRYKNDFIEKDIRSPLSFDELVIRFDKAPSVWVRIEAAHIVYNKYRDKFEAFALSRLHSTTEKARVELIRILGMLDSPKALNEIAPFLTSGDKYLCCAAFMALDSAGSLGHSILDKRLAPPSTFMYLLQSVFTGTDIEKKALRARLISIKKLRRLNAVTRKTGVPLPDLLEGIGFSL
ncbi:hypothetical protein MNBD_NITROSPINAE02-910 [hydrothermal vent metagenome]|uniref:J domain-containing protein n=1 Tax=hydrothermal vent metagenome TaxID=652676 RepID=A0A3B1CGM9_9ZZZZ